MSYYIIANAAGEPNGCITSSREHAERLLVECEQMSGEPRIILTYIDDALPMGVADSLVHSAAGDELTSGLLRVTKTTARVKGYATDLDLRNIAGTADWDCEAIAIDGGPHTVGERSRYAAARRIERKFSALLSGKK